MKSMVGLEKGMGLVAAAFLTSCIVVPAAPPDTYTYKPVTPGEKPAVIEGSGNEEPRIGTGGRSLHSVALPVAVDGRDRWLRHTREDLSVTVSPGQHHLTVVCWPEPPFALAGMVEIPVQLQAGGVYKVHCSITQRPAPGGGVDFWISGNGGEIARAKGHFLGEAELARYEQGRGQLSSPNSSAH